jgi:cell division protein YceG involved in septum cleavage
MIVKVITDPEAIKRFQESEKKHEAFRKGIREGRNISEIAKELGMKLVNPLEEANKKKRIKQIIDIACGPPDEEDEDEEEEEEGTTMPW